MVRAEALVGETGELMKCPCCGWNNADMADCAGCGYGFGRERLLQLQHVAALTSPGSILSRLSRSVSLFAGVCLMLALLAALYILGGITLGEPSDRLNPVRQICLGDSLSAALQALLLLAAALSITCFVSIGTNLRRMSRSIQTAWRLYFE